MRADSVSMTIRSSSSSIRDSVAAATRISTPVTHRMQGCIRVRDWLFTVRGYRSDDTSSLQGMIRRYLGGPDSYVGLRFGKGSTREDIRSMTDIEALDSIDVAAEGRFILRSPWS